MPGDDGTAGEAVSRVNAWVLTELPRLNQDILARRRPAGDLGTELSRSVLADLPRPETLTAVQAQQMVVLLGLAGVAGPALSGVLPGLPGNAGTCLRPVPGRA